MMDNTSTSIISARWGSILLKLGIEPGEGKAVGLLFAQSFLVGLTYFALYTAGMAIFLSYFDASAIAYVFVASAVLLILIGIYFNRLEQRIPFATLLLGSMGSLLLVYCLLRIGLWATASSASLAGLASWVAFLLLVALRVSWTVLNLVIWSLAGRLFNVRQSKRLYPLIIVGTVLAIIISGLVVQPLIALLGIPNLLWLSIGSTATTTGLLALTLRIFRQEVASVNYQSTPPAPTEKSASSNQPSWLAPYRDRFVFWMLAFVTFSTLATFLLEYIFISEAKLYYQDATAYASFFGSYLGITTLILLVVSVFSGTIFERLGLRVGLMSNAAAVSLFALLAFIGYLLVGPLSALFWLVVLTKLCDDVLVVAMSGTSTRILYQVVPASRRVWLQTVVESIMGPAAIGVVGIFLIGLQFVGELSTLQLLLILIAICMVWIFASIKVHGAYRGALQNALLKRRFATIDPEQSTAERAQVLREGLQSEHPAVVLYSVDMLMEGEPVRALLPELLTHPAVEVRLNIAQRIERLDWSGHIDQSTPESWLTRLQERLSADSPNPEPSPQVRASLCRALIALAEASGDQDALAHASAYLLGEDDLLRDAALVGLLRHGGIQSVLTAGPKLLELVDSPNEEERILAAQVVGQVGESKFYQPLLSLLADEKSDVRNAAIQASGNVKNSALWQLVAQGLSHASTRKNATRALAQGGEAVLPTLSELFVRPKAQRDDTRQPHQDDDAQIALVKALGQIGGPQAIDLLWKRLDFKPYTGESSSDEQSSGEKSHDKQRSAVSPAVRAEIWRALRRSEYKADKANQSQIDAALDFELREASWLMAARGAVVDAGGEQLVVDALSSELAAIRRSLFDLLTFIRDKPLVMRVRYILLATPTLPANHEGAAGDTGDTGAAGAAANQSHRDNEEQRANAQEVLDDLLPAQFKQWLMPLLSNEPSDAAQKSMQAEYPAPTLSYRQWLLTLINASDAQLIPWTKACAIYAAKKLINPKQPAQAETASEKSTDNGRPAVASPTKPQDVDEQSPKSLSETKNRLVLPDQQDFALLDAITLQQQNQKPLIRETATWEYGGK